MTNPRMTLLIGALALIGLVFVAIHLGVMYATMNITLPPYRPVDEVVFQEAQNWTADERQWFYHETQGGAFELIVPYKWLMALEQPRIPLSIIGSVDKFTDVDYISRFGFLPDTLESFDPANTSITWAEYPGHDATPDPALNNPDRLPVGFARNRDYRWPVDTNEPMDVMGFACAACHTGQVNYEDSDGKYWGYRVTGGPAMINLTKFELAVGVSIALTYYLPQRFERFADEVLGEDAPESERGALKDDLKKTIEQGKKIKAASDKVYTTMDGFARLDALGRIGNFVFAEEISSANWSVSNAPVNFPPLWDAPWFDWVQYNASIKQPMIRNAGEALGVFSRADFTSIDDPEKLFKSTARIDNLTEIESLLRGDAPMQGLKSPKWPSAVFGAPDARSVTRGRDLYEKNCKSCHRAAPIEGTGFYDFSDREIWTEPDSVTGRQFLNLKIVNLYEVGTDSLTAVNFIQRIVELGPLGEMYKDSSDVAGLTPMGAALPFVVEKVKNKRYDELGLSEEQRLEWDGFRPNEIQALLAYKARPLDGIWSTAPYLHNGSVPTLMQLLGPYQERDQKFWLGTKNFDPVNVGFVTDRLRGGFKFDVSLPGNSNFGHLFNGEFDKDDGIDYSDPDWRDKMDWRRVRRGTIGRELSLDERKDIIAFLKTL